MLVTTFTPGPNNISAMAVGIAAGYRRSLRFLAGITLGFFAVMCACAVVAGALRTAFPWIQPVLRIGGALYIAWLALHTFLGGLRADAREEAPLGFSNGLLLQLLNGKVIVYGLTLYSTFLAALGNRGALLALTAAAAALVGFCATSTWSLAGAVFTRLLSREPVRRVASAVLALVLLYTAVESSGLLELLVHGAGAPR